MRSKPSILICLILDVNGVLGRNLFIFGHHNSQIAELVRMGGSKALPSYNLISIIISLNPGMWACIGIKLGTLLYQEVNCMI